MIKVPLMITNKLRLERKKAMNLTVGVLVNKGTVRLFSGKSVLSSPNKSAMTPSDR